MPYGLPLPPMITWGSEFPVTFESKTQYCRCNIQKIDDYKPEVLFYRPIHYSSNSLKNKIMTHPEVINKNRLQCSKVCNYMSLLLVY